MLTKKFVRNALALSLCMTLGACANNPQLREKEKLKMDDVEKLVKEQQEEFNKVWSETDPAITFLQREDTLFVKQLYDIPGDIYNQKIVGMTLLPGSTLKTLSGALYPYGVSLAFKDFKSEKGESSGLGDLPFSIKKFNGSIGQLLEMVSSIHDISFEHVGGSMLKVSNSSKYMISLPQVDNVLESVAENIEALGAENIKTNTLAGSVVYEASYRENRDIRNFMSRFYENYAGVKFQITIFNVSLQETLTDGFDWSSLDLVLGNVEAAYAGGYIDQLLASLAGNTDSTGTGSSNNNNNNNNNTDNNNDNDSDEPEFNYRSRYAGSSIDDIRSFTWINEDKFQVGAFNNNVSVSMALDWMNQYGNTQAKQSAFIETITGKETVIASQRKVPVIADESTTLVGNLSPVATQNTKTENEEIGVKVKFTPYYDASSQEMIIDLDVNLKSFVGNQKLTSSTGVEFYRPEIQEETFPTMVRMKVGETRLLGGVIFDTVAEDRNDVNLFDFDRGYISRVMSKSAMFIMIRPTIQMYSAPDKGVADEPQ